MSSQNNDVRETAYRTIFHNMDAARAQEIRDAYYKAIEGLRSLSESLEIADLSAGQHAGGILIEEHLIAVEALDGLRRSELGRVL